MTLWETMSKPRKPAAKPTMPPPERRVTLCVVGAPHGVRGECRVKAFTADPLAITDYGALFAGDGRVFEITSGRLLKDDMLVVKFAGLDDRNAAQTITNLELFVDREALPPPDDEDEFYYADLIGLAIVDTAGEAIGTLSAIHDFGAGDVLEIRPVAGGPTWLQPFTKIAVPKVDMAANCIVIDTAFLTKPEPRSAKPADEPED